MASLFNTRISDTYVGLIKSLDNAVISTTLKQLSDGSGNSLGIYVNTSGDFKVTGILEWGSLKDTGEDITITKFVDEADGIANNDNDTTIPTTAAVIDYVASRITLEDLDFSGDSGSGSVDLDSQTFAIVGTTNEIETSATGQTLTIGLPNNVTITGETSVGSLKTSGVYYFNGNTISHLSNSDLIFGFKSTTGFRVSTNGGLTDDILIASGSISGNLILDEDNMASNSATKLATQQSIKAYVDSQVGANNELSEVLANGNTTGGTDIAVSAGDDITFTDTSKALFGTSSVLQIYHDGSNSYIKEAGTGNLILNANNFRIEDNSTNPYLFATAGAEVTIYHNGSPKFVTTSTGVKVTGGARSDFFTSDGGRGFKQDSVAFVSTYSNGSDANNANDIGSSSNKWRDAYFAGVINTGTISSGAITTSGNNSTFGGQVGIGVSPPSDAHATWSQLFLGEKGSLISEKSNTGGIYGMYITDNLYLDNDTGNFAYITTDEASAYRQEAGQHQFYTVASGTAGGAATLSEKMILDSSGNLGLGVTSPNRKLEVSSGGSDVPQIRASYDTNNYVDIKHDAINKVGGSTLRLQFGGSNALTINSSQNVGIGTSSPASTLHISKAVTLSASTEHLLIQNTTTGEPSALAFTAVADNGGAGNEGAIYFDAGADGSASNNIIAFNADHQTDNNYDMVITGAGLVGIGTTSPSAPLSIQTSSTSQTIRLIGRSADGSSYIQFRNNADSSNYAEIGSDNNSVLLFNTNGSERARLDSSGRLLLNTTTEGQANADDLTIANTSGDCGITIRSATTGGSKIFFSDGTTGTAEYDGYIIYDHNGNSMQFGQGNSENMRLDSSGNLAIGGTSASAKLDVTGTAGLMMLKTSTGNAFYVENDTNYAKAYLYEIGGGVKIQLNTNGDSYFNGGSVGIGTSSPSDEVHISKSVNGDTTLQIENSNTGTSARADLYLQSDSARLDIYATSSTYNGVASWTDSGVITTSSDTSGGLTLNSQAGGIKFQTATNERLRITSAGNVGIGESNPNKKLHINSGTSNAGIQLNSTDANSYITYLDDTTTSADYVFTGANGDDLILGAGAGERMRITSGGNVEVGSSANAKFVIYPSSDGAAAPFVRWNKTDTASQTAVQFLVSGVVSGSITYSSTATAYNTTSDYRLKENVVELTGALDRISQLKPSRFNFIADAETTVDGFLAHEVQDIVPEAITGEKDATEEYEVTPEVLDDEGNVIEEAVMGTRDVYQGIDQSKLVPLLVASIQELEARVKELENK